MRVGRHGRHFYKFLQNTRITGVIVARLTMEQLEQLAIGQGIDAGTSQHLEGAGTSQHLVWYQPTVYTRILDAVERGGAHTRLEIARWLGVKKTVWLVQSIEKLVTAGYLTRIEGRAPWGTIMWFYEVRK